jgi:hypothetical protein
VFRGRWVFRFQIEGQGEVGKEEKKEKKRSPSISSFENNLNGLIPQLVHWWVLGHRGHAK